MEFKLTQEQEAMKETAHSFAAKALEPKAAAYDEMGAPYPADWMAEAAELGFMNMVAPDGLGGIGAGTLDAGVVIEELATGCAGMAAAVAGSLAGVMAMLNSGAPEGILKQKLAEPYQKDPRGFRGAVAGIFDTPFKVVQDGTLNGKEVGVIGAGHATWYAVTAREGDQASCWLLTSDTEGLEAERTPDTLGIRAAQPGRLSLKGAEDTRLGAINTDSMLAVASTFLGCAAVGCARAALDAAIDYARDRYQGCDQIIRHDAVAHLILSNRARIDAARSRLLQVMTQNDELIDPETGAFTKPPDLNASVLARVFALDAAMQATTDAVQCFGGYGYMHDYPVEKRMRDARSLGVIFGANPDLLTYIKSSLEED